MDGTEERKNTSQATGDTSSEKQETSTKTEETFTKSQRDKAVSDSLAAAGRTAKSFEKREEAITKAEEKVAREKQEKYEAEKRAAKDDPDLLSVIERNRKASERKAELDERERKLNTMQEGLDVKLDKATKAEIKERAIEVAVKHTVSQEDLINFTDGSLEKMEELAKKLPKKGDVKAEPLKVDSSKTIGAGEDLSGLTPVERAGKELKIARQMQKKRRAGEDDIDYKP